jgi:nitrous oxidase accessory protein NosD
VVYYSHNNVIYHNKFVNSLLYTENRNGTQFTPKNSWDNGLEGNYWSDYTGEDADGDGIGDTPYMVGKDNVDNYPLMRVRIHTAISPWLIVAVASVFLIVSVLVFLFLKKKF